MHVGHITWPKNHVTLDTFGSYSLMWKFSASPRGVREIQHPDQGPVTVFKSIALTVNGWVATANRVLLNI